ncbi:MAG: tRNA 4-thiouridine(8) synthase ThiI [Eubacteriales bacterium]|nr:tRNA 4-thiouridine(8) synthase ThiI [Eubacteriales bacterium]
MSVQSLLTNTPLPKDKILLVRLGEITLKGMNRHKFEQQVIRNMKHRLKDLGHFAISQSHSRIWVEPDPASASGGFSTDSQIEHVIDRVKDVFGVVSVSPVWRFAGGIEAIEAMACEFVSQLLSDGRKQSFKVESRRGLKSFPYQSPEISGRVGGLLAETFSSQLTVNVKEPDFILYVEVREHNYLYSSIIKAQRGLPVGTSGHGLLLLSGGIDSPVAGYLMASRGMMLDAMYFHAYPFTSDQAREKVVDLARLIARYAGRIRLHVVNFTDIQITLRDFCPPEMMTIVMRRMMMRIADRFAESNHLKALITGESLGQVASQTLEALVTTDQISTRPVFRPLIGLDKDDTVAIARRIGTFETSILPFEDCCTVFVAKHPKTHPSLTDAVDAEKELDIDALVTLGLGAIETEVITPRYDESAPRGDV